MSITVIRYFIMSMTLCSIFSWPVFAQKEKVDEEIHRVIEAARNGQLRLPESFVFDAGNVTATVDGTIPFTYDSNKIVRNQAYLIIHKAGIAKEGADRSIQVVEALAHGCHDSQVGIALYCSKSLRQYDSKEFTANAKGSIAAALLPGARTVPNIAMLIGWLGIEESMGRLQSIAYQDGASRVDQWHAHLALARMGVEQSIRYCLSVYKSQPMNTALVEQMVPDLLYTRQKSIYDEVIQLLYEKDKLCYSLSPDNERQIHCGYLLMEQLSKYIEDYPFETHATGALKGHDYDESLVALRAWFTNTPYTIRQADF